MKIEVFSQQDNVLVLNISGQLDTLTSSEANSIIESHIIGKSAIQLTLDFADVSFMSSAGLRMLLALQKRIRSEHGSFTLINVNDNVRRVFEITGLRDAFGL